MKVFLSSLCFALFLLLGAASYSQELVSTGMIAGYQPKEGTLTIRSDQTQALVTFFGVDKANIFTADGKPTMLGNLPMGARVTVQYATRDAKWYVSKVILPAETTSGGSAAATGGAAPMPQSLQINAEPSTSSAAIRANDGDITTSGDAKQPRVDRLKTIRSGQIQR